MTIHLSTLPTNLIEAQQVILLLKETLQRRSMHPAFAIPNRYALDDAWGVLDHTSHYAIFFDGDDFSACNQRYTQAGVDQRLRAAFAALRDEIRHGDTLFQFDGGDMFCWLLPKETVLSGWRQDVDPVAAARRLQAILLTFGLSMSAAIVLPAPDLIATATKAEKLYKAARGGGRGQGVRGVLVVADEVLA